MRERPRTRTDRPPLRKSLGQHHLRDPRSVRPLVEFLRLAAGEHVVEIGAGGGLLTRELLATGATVVAVELDLAWVGRLARGLRGSGDGSRDRTLLVAADALALDWSRLPPRWPVAGNLPYNVGTVIVERLLGSAPAGVRAAFLLQREVVERMVARPGDEAYGALSVLVAARAVATRLGRVPPGAFVPAPKVESAFVGLETVAPPLPAGGMAALEATIRAAFGQRRKSLRNALGTAWGREVAERRLRAAAIDPGRRAETLALDDFVRLQVVAARDASSPE